MAQWVRSLTMEAWRPEFESLQHPHKQAGCVYAHTCNLSFVGRGWDSRVKGRIIAGACWLPVNFRTSERLCLQGIRRVTDQDIRTGIQDTHLQHTCAFNTHKINYPFTQRNSDKPKS